MDKIDGRYLRDMRKERGYSLRAFAEVIYVSKSSVLRWEQSSVPENTDVLNKLSEILGVSIENMRRQSAEKYGANYTDGGKLSADERAEIKFGIKGLGIVAAALCAFLITITSFIIFLN